MSGEPPEPNRQQMTDSVPPQQTGSAPVRGFVTAAPTVLQRRLGTHGNWLPLGASSVGGPQIYPAMSGEAPEPNRKQMTDSVPPQQTGSAPVTHHVPIAPGFQEQLGTLAIWLPSGASSVSGPQPTAGVSGAALSNKTKKEPGALTGKSVVVLKPCDVVVRNETVFMPNTIEMAQLKKTEKGQFKKNVQFSSKMAEMDVKGILVATFPFLDCKRFYCAAAADNRTRLDFQGERRIWDGRFLKQVIKGNSALYIFAEEDSTGRRQIEASGSDNPSLSASSKPITPSINNKSIKPSAAFSNTGAHLWSVRTVAETAAATVTTLEHPMSPPSLAIENQHAQNAIPTSSVCATQVSTQSMLRRSYEGYDQSSKKRKRAGNVSKHSKSNTVNRLRRKRSHTMTSSNSVPMSVSCPVASDQQCLEQPISPVTGAVTDTSMLAAQMENLGFREKAGFSGKRVDNGADSRPDDQSTLLPTWETSELGGQPHNGWSLGASSYSLTGEQSYFTDQRTLDELYRDRVGVSIQELDSIPRMEINRQQETAVIAGPRTQGFTEGSDHYNTSSDINATSSGICSDDGDLVSSDQSNSENLSQDQPIRIETNQDFKPEVNPRRVPFYQGAPVFLVKFEHPPPREFQSLRAEFESLGHVLLRRLNDDTFSGERMPAASRPCVVIVSVESESGRPLGETEVEYFDDPSIYATLFRHLASKYDESNGHGHGDTSNSANGGSSDGNTQGDTGSSGNGGFTQQLQSLQHLVNAMVASGAQWLIEPIFKSTAGRMLLHSYKETSQLPEVIARENGHEETARFLADITQRLSEETEFFPDDVQEIDWSELVFLVERAQEQKICGIVVDQENYQAENDLTIDTSYFGDVETSSGNLSPQSKSDSDDNSSEISFEDSFEEDETQVKTDAFKTYSGEKADLPFPDLSDVNFPKEGKTEDTLFQCNKGVNAMENLNKDRSLQLALHSPATGSSGCLMSLNDVNGKGRRYKNTGICKENFFLQTLPDLQNGKSVYRNGVSVLLKLASEDMSRHLSTMHERWITRIQLNKNLTEETTQLLSVVMRKNELNPAEGGSTSVTQPAATMKSNFVQGLESPDIDDDVSIQEDSRMGGRLLDQAVYFCRSSSSKIWVLHCLYRPTRKTVFVYVGDSQDFFPLEWFEDEDCELSRNCWKWCEYRDSLGERVMEVQEQSELKESQQDPSPSNPPVTYQVPGYANMAPQSEESSRTAVATATQNRVDLDAAHSLPIGSSVDRESHFLTQPPQSTFCASSVGDSPKELPVLDRKGFFPPESFCEDEDCELLMECWKWRRSTDNFLELIAASSDHPETKKAKRSLDNSEARYRKTSVPPLHVTLLGDEWGSSGGGLSTINRELAIHLSSHSAVEVSLLVPEGACNIDEIREADGYGITIVEAKERAAYDCLDWLSIPPEDHFMDIVVGHGVKLGRQAQLIKDSPQFSNCKWVQVACTVTEELSRYKCYTDPISKAETKHESEVELCKLADLVVPVGPRLKEAYSSYLRRCKTDEDVLSFTPGLFQREFGDLVEKQDPNEDGEFRVLLFGRGDDEGFELKGYNIAAKAFADQRLKNKPYHLIFVGAAEGKQEEVRGKLLQRGIAEAQLSVRTFIQNRDRVKDLLCEADLAIMPSKSEGFGFVALEALSSGLPILVGSRSGFAKALENVPHGHTCIVNSDDPAEWAKAIEALRIRYGIRLQEIKLLRASYGEMYSWKEQCKGLVNKMWKMVYETATTVKISVTTRDLSSELEDVVDRMLRQQLKVYLKYAKTNKLSTASGLSDFIRHLENSYNVALTSVGMG